MCTTAENSDFAAANLEYVMVVYHYLREAFPGLDVDIHPQAQQLSFIGKEEHEIALKGMTEEAKATLNSQRNDNEAFIKDLAKLFNTLVYIESVEDIGRMGTYMNEARHQLRLARKQQQENFRIRAKMMEILQGDAEGEMVVHVGPRWPEFRDAAKKDIKELCEKYDYWLKRLDVMMDTVKREHAELLKRVEEMKEY